MSEYLYESSPLVALSFGLLSAILAVGLGCLIVGRLVRGLPVGAIWGICGAIGYGIVGLITFLFGLVGVFGFGFFVVGGVVWAALGLFGLWKERAMVRPISAESSVSRLLIFCVALFILIRLPAVFTPSAGADWDSTSHQLAMSKIWLMKHQVDYIPWMNHSNIPATVNMLYAWGLEFGGQAGAKMIGWVFAIFACLGVAGLTAHRYGRRAGNWSALAFICVPVILWELGTAYQDVIHGFYGGAAVLLAAISLFDGGKRWIWLAGIMLGFSIATKYTGFQIAFGLLVAALLVGGFTRSLGAPIKLSFAISVIAVAIASPWYVRNVINTGNPVYPFFYSVFGGRDWSPDMAHAYAVEQKRFGVWTFDGSERQDDELQRNPATIPGAITALALQPHRHINGGVFWGAMGPLLLLGALFWCFSGKIRRAEAFCVLAIFVTLLTWFFLTQQSRYIIGLMVPGAFLLGGVINYLALRALAIVAIVAQAMISFFWFTGAYVVLAPGASSEFASSLRFVTSGEPESAYLSGGDFGGGKIRRFPFWEATEYLNALHHERQDVKVALLDEVRGFYLDCEYFWASPGFSKVIPWDEIETPERFAAALKEVGATHVYMNYDPTLIGDRDQTIQLQFVFSTEFFNASPGDDRIARFRKLVVDAYRAGLLRRVETFDAPAQDVPPLAVLLEVN